MGWAEHLDYHFVIAALSVAKVAQLARTKGRRAGDVSERKRVLVRLQGQFGRRLAADEEFVVMGGDVVPRAAAAGFAGASTGR